MSPDEPNTISDHESANVRRGRGRPPAASRTALLEAAGAVFDRADADAARGISMDTVAVASGVGKATVFRTFGDRDGLLDALSAARFAPLKDAVSDGAPPFDPGTPPSERAVAFLDAVLDFKLANGNVLRAREAAAGDLRSDRYRWTHGVLRELLDQAAPSVDDTALAAHALLAALRIDLLDELIGQGHPVELIRSAQRERVRDLVSRTR